jgi:actin-related protein
LAPQILRKTVVQLLFERFKVSKVKVSQYEPIALYATSISGQSKTPTSSSHSSSEAPSSSSDHPEAHKSSSKTPTAPNLDGLVIDMGFGEIRVVPVYQGIVLSSAIQTTSHSWQNVVALMRERMQSSCPLSYPALPQRPPLLPSPALRRWVIEDVITKVCFVTARRFNETVSVDPSQQQKASSL